MAKFILAIDQGTTGTTVAILDQFGRTKARVTHDFRQIYPQPGWVEHDPEDIWRSVQQAMQSALAQSGVSAAAIAGIGITNQRETVVMWDRKTGHPIYNAIVWQCRRTSDFCRRLRRSGYERSIRAKTGLVLDPYFSASKINWLLKNVTGAKAKARGGELAVGTIDSFLLWRLTDGRTHATDVSNASRTMLMNLKTLAWDNDLLEIFQVPAAVLPQIRPSSGQFGVTKGLGFLPDGVPIAGVAGDQQAALFGQAGFSPGIAKCTYGTGSFLLMNTGTKLIRSKAGMLTTVAWQLTGQKATYAIEGGAFICGAAVQFLRDQLGFIKSSAEIEALASQVADSAGVEFVPALTGLGAPYWDAEARGLMTGLTRGTSRSHIARATLEAMALQNVDILEAMQKDLGKKLKEVRVDGGASANNLLMQMQADFIGVKINRPKMIETTVAGAAFLAGLGVGLWSSTDALAQVWASEKIFSPSLKENLRRERLKRWRSAVGRALAHPKRA